MSLATRAGGPPGLLQRLYSWLWHLALPFALLRLVWRARQEPDYLRHLAERLGRYPPRAPGGPILWVHAVSLGETRAAQPLVTAMLHAWPGHRILLTHMTPTGRQAGRQLFAAELQAGRMLQAWLPYDLSWAMQRFLKHYQPVLGVIMETEVWPCMLAACRTQAVPLVLVNARMSARSAARAARFGQAAQGLFAGFSLVLAQTEADAARFRQLGVETLQVTGNLKFDMPIPQMALERSEWLQCWIQQRGPRLVFCASSTREGEEELVLQAWRTLLSDWQGPRPLLLLVPRHPQRFDAVAQLVRAQGWTLQRRSQLSECADTDCTDEEGEGGLPQTLAESLGGSAAEVDVLLGDSLGEMPMYYAASDLAFIGGSLLPLGGQNLIEACALCIPVLVGPHTFNFAQATEDAIVEGAAWRVADASALAQAAQTLLGDDGRRHAMGHAAQAYAQRHRGATERTVQALQALLGM